MTASAKPAPPAAPEPVAPAPTPAAPVSTGHRLRTIASAIFSWVIFPIGTVVILNLFVFQAYHVDGTSMLPNLHNSDYLIVSKLGQTGADLKALIGHPQDYLPTRGQIIVFHYPKDPTKVFVKRVVGRPGDRVVVKDGAVTVYEQNRGAGINPDATVEHAGTTTLGNIDEIVQPGNLFVLGDNRTPGGSSDSREWGELPSSDIIGHAVVRLLPVDQFKLL